MAGYVYRGSEPDVPTPPASKPGPKPTGRPPGREPFDPAKCGTYAGYQQHTRHGSDKCDPCQEAYNAYQSAYYARKRAA